MTTLFLSTLLACTPIAELEDSTINHQNIDPVNLLSSSNRSILFYNVENLFDTENDPNKSDEEFTPEGSKKWTVQRYNDKLKALAKVIDATGKNDPVLIGLAEIENRKVIVDLTKESVLSENNYKVVHDESPDNRGIDVGLIYDADRFQYISHQSYRVDFPWDASIKSRDVLHVKGAFANFDTVHIFVNHWPSRRGGAEASEPKRMQAAKTLRKAIDSVLDVNPNAKILCMGDFNDHPTDNSLIKGLKAGRKAVKPMDMVNLMTPLAKAGLGSHNYKGEWGMLDQIIASYSFLKLKKGVRIKKEEAKIFKKDWMLYKGESPSKTYGGPNYYGGYSDHLPVYVILK